MHPVLFDLFGHEVRTYSVAMAMAFVVSIILLRRRAPYEQIDVNLALNLAILAIVGTILGGRLMFVINTWHERFATPDRTTWQVFLEVWKVWEGGLVFYGGFLGTILIVWVYLRINKIAQSPMLDLLSPYVGLGLAVHRPFGCYLNGCCYGGPTHVPWAVHFPLTAHATKIYGIEQALHPTEIYMGLSGLFLFFLLRWFRERKQRQGEVFGLLLMVYAINRFLIEFVRGDAIRGYVPMFDLIWVAIFAGGLTLWLGARGMKTRRKWLEALGVVAFLAAGGLGLFGTESGSQNPASSPFSTSQYIGFFVFLAGAAGFYRARHFGDPVQPEYGQYLAVGALSGHDPTRPDLRETSNTTPA